MKYKRWIRILNIILLRRFGISVNDSFDDCLLRSFFSRGETPMDIAEDLKQKRGLIDL
ncbi:MAG: hypothetical protein KAR40_17570 [Candidatus Sabulitectum sp.]|nr:hypothetical protein [Candidatus Sabulitectum sp.]